MEVRYIRHVDDSEYLMHYGKPRRSGRYPWGSGEEPYRRLRQNKSGEITKYANILKGNSETSEAVNKSFSAKVKEKKSGNKKDAWIDDLKDEKEQKRIRDLKEKTNILKTENDYNDAKTKNDKINKDSEPKDNTQNIINLANSIRTGSKDVNSSFKDLHNINVDIKANKKAQKALRTASKMTDEEIKTAVNRIKLEDSYASAVSGRYSSFAPPSKIQKLVAGVGATAAIAATAVTIYKISKELQE